jgi:hypothetical protein
MPSRRSGGLSIQRRQRLAPDGRRRCVHSGSPRRRNNLRCPAGVRSNRGSQCDLWASVLLLPLRHDPQRVVRKGPLQCQRLRGIGLEPLVNLGGCRQNDRHGLGVNRCDDCVSLGRQEAEKLMLALDTSALRTAYAAPGSPQTGKGEQGPVLSFRANRMGILRGLVSAYSQNDVAGTMQRFPRPSHPRQCGLPACPSALRQARARRQCRCGRSAPSGQGRCREIAGGCPCA